MTSADPGLQRQRVGTFNARSLSAFLLWLCLCITGCSTLPPNGPRRASTALPDASGTALGRLVANSVPGSASAASTANARTQSATSSASPSPSPSPSQLQALQRRADSGFRLLIRSDDAFGSRMALIDAAQKTLDLQYYAIHYDGSTEVLLERLRDAARRGVRVRILIDDFNAVGRNIEVLRLDLEPGIEIRMFNPVAGSRGGHGRILGSLFDFQRIQQRMHNKVFIADNALAVTGGRNLGDEYFGQGQNSNFLDLDVLAAGRIVRELSQSFDRYWNHELAYPVQSLLTPDELVRLRTPFTQAPVTTTANAAAAQPVAAPTSTPLPATGQASAKSSVPAAPQVVPGAVDVAADIAAGKLQLVWAPSALLVDQPSKIASEDPADTEETVIDGLLDLIAKAREDLLIVSPYFVPGERMMQTFTALRQRGVRIRVLTNSLASNDAPLAHVGYARYRVALLKAGVELFEMRSQGETRRRLFGSAPSSRASLHSKTFVMDGRLLAVGSMNLDLRSELQNTEIGLLIRSATLSASMRDSIEQTLRDSYRVEWSEGKLQWYPPADSRTQQPATALQGEPDAGFGLQFMLKLIGPFAPSEML
jgi:cardiolipin synthase C